MHSRILLIVLGTILGVGSLGSRPAEMTAGTPALQPRVLIVFKNGLSWIEHRGEIALTDGWGSIPMTPEAALGTVSLTSDETKVDEVRTIGGLQSAVRGGATLEAMLARSAGRMVTLRVGDRDVSGRLLPSPEQRPSANVEVSMRGGWMETPGIVLLESGGKTTAVQRGLITAATFDGEVPTADDSITPSLRFHVEQRSGSTPMRLSYVRPGIGWFPDYSIILDGKGRAALTMRATLVDDGEDLRDTDVFFAVGVPNFAFGHVESPFSARQSLAELFLSLGRGASEAFSALSNAVNVTSQAAMPHTERGSGFAAMTTAGTEGQSAEDFFGTAFWKCMGRRHDRRHDPHPQFQGRTGGIGDPERNRRRSDSCLRPPRHARCHGAAGHQSHRATGMGDSITGRGEEDDQVSVQGIRAGVVQ